MQELNYESSDNKKTKEKLSLKTPTQKFYLSLFNDSASVSLEVFNQNEFKIGYRPHIGWGSVKEEIIHAFLED